MRLDLVVIGSLKAGPERDLVQRYAERLEATGRPLHLAGLAIAELPESAARRAEDRKIEEGRAILDRLGSSSRLVLFDEGGKAEDSEAFSRMIGDWRDTGCPSVAFVIGGPDGLAHDLHARADRVLAFGRMTIPHQLVRVLVLEQLYRAATILAGHPYHRV